MLWSVLSGQTSGFAPWGPAAFAAGQVFLFLDDYPSTANTGFSCTSIGVECGELSIKGQFGAVFQALVSRERTDIPYPIIFDDNVQTSMLSSNLDKISTSPANVTLAKTWLANCLDCHRPCNAGDFYPALPRRVVDLSNPEAPRLVYGDDVKGQYIALSYKWGGSRKCITTSDNVGERMHSIPIETIPKTFQEAIEVTHHLGFHYLWIDSLCIIQDSEEDLDTEIKSMDRVYQNATLTIFAAGADDIDSGLSIARDPRETKPCQVNVKLTARGHTSDITTLISFYKDHVRSGHYPLFDRGWVLQEQVMSRRGLIFGSRFMSWECLCARSSEKWPTVTAKVDELPTILYSSSIDDNLYSSTDVIPMMRIAVAHQRRTPSEVFDKWYEMVQDYSMRTLSYPSDVLRALSGLSNAVGRLYKSTYAFGLWLEDLLAGLTWFIRKPLATSSNPLPNAEEHFRRKAGFPTWTWISHWGHEIQFRPAMRYDCFEYEGIETSGGVSPGSNTGKTTLILSGCLKPAEARPLLADWTGEDRERPLWFGSVCDAGTGEEVGQIAFDEDPETVQLSAITCFLCSMGTYRLDELFLTCLALVPTLGSEEEYRRVGLVFLDKDDWFDRSHDGNLELEPSAEVPAYSRIRIV
ncbi:MAG: hypothetical protein M1839_001698 [Geoglossum umbratile]|nr:MAG: hypothetical protein M1839_001698 [Geoglossum umbratile]